MAYVAGLAVLPTDVVNAADVALRVSRVVCVGCRSGRRMPRRGRARVRSASCGVGPFVEERADESFDLAVPARRVGRDPDVLGSDRGEQPLEAAGVGVDEGVVGHHRFGRFEPEFGQLRECPLERVCVGVGVLARVQLDVGEAGVVVDDAVQVVVADLAAAPAAVACGAVAGLLETGELLHVHVQQRARPRPLVATVARAWCPRPLR